MELDGYGTQWPCQCASSRNMAPFHFKARLGPQRIMALCNGVTGSLRRTVASNRIQKNLTIPTCFDPGELRVDNSKSIKGLENCSLEVIKGKEKKV